MRKSISSLAIHPKKYDIHYSISSTIVLNCMYFVANSVDTFFLGTFITIRKTVTLAE